MSSITRISPTSEDTCTVLPLVPRPPHPLTVVAPVTSRAEPFGAQLSFEEAGHLDAELSFLDVVAGVSKEDVVLG